MLLGIILIFSITGTMEITALLSSGDMLRDSSLYPAVLILIAIAYFTKSAQTPFHIRLRMKMGDLLIPTINLLRNK